MATFLFALGFLAAVAGVVWIARRTEGTRPSRGNRYLHGASGTDMATPGDSYGDSHNGGGSDGGGWSGGDGGGWSGGGGGDGGGGGGGGGGGS